MIEITSSFPSKGYIESKIGGRPENQDSCSYQDTSLGLLVLVCDGMGGMNGGSTASSMAVQSIITEMMSVQADEDPVTVITQAVNHANEAIINAGMSNPALKGMGTTLTLLLLTPRCAYTTYVGDSRIYQLRGKKKVYRTFDHSVVFQLVKQGVITEEQARLSSQSNVIMQALGVKAQLDFVVEQLPYEKRDRFVLCTDGYWGSMSEPDLLARICSKKHIGRIIHETTMEVDGKGAAKGGGHDNLTVAMVEVQTDSIIKEKMSKLAKLIVAGLAALLTVSLALNVVQFIKNASEDARQGEEFISKNQLDGLLKENSDSLNQIIADKDKEIKSLQTDIANKEKVLKQNEKDMAAAKDLEKKLRTEIDVRKAQQEAAAADASKEQHDSAQNK